MTTAQTVLRPLALVTAVGMAVALAGCDTRSPSSQAVSNASTKVAIAGLQSASPEQGAQTLPQAVAEVKSLNGTEAEQASASLLLAQASMSEGEKAAGDSMRLDREIRIGLSELVDMGNQWARSNSLAAAAGAFDPAKQIAELTAQSAEKDKQIAQTRQERQETQARVSELRNQAKATLDEAQKLHTQAAELAQRASEVSAREGVGLVEQSTSLRRQGDAKVMTSEQTITQADQIAPRVTELEALARQYENQKANLAKSQEALLATQTAKRQEADEARAAANTTAQALKARMDALLAQHSGEYTAVFDKAVGAYGRAAGESRKAGSSAGAKLSQGSAELALAGLHQRNAQLSRSVAATLELLAQIKPSLPGGSDLASRASSLREAGKTSADTAKTAIEDAKNAFGGVKVKGQAESERVEQLTGMLDRLAAAQAADADPVAGARALAESAITAMKEGRWDDVKAMYAVSTDAGKEMLDGSFKAVSAGARIEKAFQSKFNTSFSDALKSAPGGQMIAPMMSQLSKGDMSGVDVATVKYTPNEKGVQVEMGGVGQPLLAVLKDGAWKFDGSQIDAMAPAMAMQTQALSGVLAQLDGFAGRVEAGEFADANAAAMAFMEGMQKAMMGGGH